MKDKNLYKSLKAYIILIVLSVFLNACSNTSKQVETMAQVKTDSSKNIANPTPLTLDATIAFLLEASAKDFNEHQPPLPSAFRNVIVRNLISNKGENNYMLCGEFLTKDKKEWTAFTTIKTSGYEQWIGASSLGFCKDSKAADYPIKDLSSALKNKLDSIQNSNNK